MKFQRRGYVLLMTLLLLVVAAIGMVALSRRSLQRAVEASRAQEELQQRWGVTSTRTAFLPAAEKMLESTEKKTRMPCRFLPIEVKLGAQRFSLLVADEQAKANVNAIYERRGKRELETSLRQLLRASHGNQTPLLRLRIPQRISGKEPAVHSFGQMFDAPDPGALASDDHSLEMVGSYVTCWGSGAVNFNRASKEALTEATAPLLTKDDVDRLVRIREKTPAISLQEALSSLALQHEKQEQILRLLTIKSDCYSLWVINDTGSRKSYNLFVRWVQPQKTETFSFSW